MCVEVASAAEPQENRSKVHRKPCVLATFTFGMEQFLRLGDICERSALVLYQLLCVTFEIFSEKDN